MTRFRSAVLFLCAFLNAASAAAIVTTYASRSEWVAFVGTFEIEDFESTPAQVTNCPEFTEGPGCPYSITIDAPQLDIIIPVGSHALGYDGIFDGGAVNGTREFQADLHAGVLVTGTSYNTIVFPNPIVAFAVDLANVTDYDVLCNVDCGPVPFPMTISIDGEDSPLEFDARFFGAASSSPFTEVVIRSWNQSGGYVVSPSLDEISFVVVPEPNFALMLGFGLLILSRGRASHHAA